MMKILIGHDGSQSADAALVNQRAGLPAETDALVVSIADVMMVPETVDHELAAEALMSRRAASSLVSEDAGSTVLLNDFNSAVLQPRLLRKHIARSRLPVIEQLTKSIVR